jgi:hypothetical protein|tara:strand:+ start:82 stop:456 length:375 start_codon:yes stop_codon:yes gene_type:complete
VNTNNVENLMKQLAILQTNRQVPFVDRIINPQMYPNPTIFDSQNRMQTHFMSASPDEEGNWFVYPNIVFESGEYKKLNLKEDDAVKYAKQTGNFISFGKDKDAAIKFSEDYKTKKFKEYYQGLL